jgi:hypothetical protein
MLKVGSKVICYKSSSIDEIYEGDTGRIVAAELSPSGRIDHQLYLDKEGKASWWFHLESNFKLLEKKTRNLPEWW